MYNKIYVRVPSQYNIVLSGKRILILFSVFGLFTQLLVAVEVNYDVYGLGPPLAAYSTGLYIDYDSWSGFQKFMEVNELGDREFELRQGTMGTFNLTLKTESKWKVYNTLWLSNRITNDDSNFLPYGITYSIEPNRPILEPNSSIVITMWIAAASDADLGKHDLSIIYSYITNDDPYTYGIGFILTIVEGIPQTTITSTSTITSVTITTSIETVTDPSIYIWATGATIIAIILPLILILRKRKVN